LDNLIGAFLGTRDVNLTTDTGKARQKGLPYDAERVELFLKLFSELRTVAPVTRAAGAVTESAHTNMAFFEAYFSNYIEGTEFAVEEAVDIVFKGVIPEDRPEDAHDVLGTYRIVSDKKDMKRVSRDFENFIALLKERHAAFMELRPDKRPGEFKSNVNRAGNTLFVAPDLVVGTLAKGYEIYRGIETPFHRAVFMMFLVSEIHPFVDGNGRAARIMMNAELVAEDEQRIIIPTVYRNNYLAALKALSQSEKPAPVIRVLDFAQKYTGSIHWEDFDTARSELEQTNAFGDSTEAEDHGVRLILPKNV
jgi:Fic family protein